MPGHEIPGTDEQPQTSTDSAQYVIVGYISGVYGVKGWVKVHSETVPPTNILTYSPWYVSQGEQWVEFPLEDGKRHGKGIVAKFTDITDRDVAAKLQGQQIAVQRSQLQPTPEGEYYWTDLIGCQVVSSSGYNFGKVASLLETGANDVLVVEGKEREHLIPYIPEQVILNVDLNLHQIEVAWEEVNE